MRDDFAKQLVERERIHSRDHYHNYRNVKGPKGAWGDDEVGGRERMRVRYNHGYDRKSFSENLNPLYGWLRSCIGKKWDKCYSELREKFDARSVVNAHILEHLWQSIATDAYLDEKGSVCVNDRYRGVVHISRSFKDYYVCPKDGTVKKVNKPTHRAVAAQKAAEAKAKELAVKRVLNDKEVLHLVDGVWYHFDLQPIPNARIEYLRPHDTNSFRIGYHFGKGPDTRLEKSWDELNQSERERFGRPHVVGGTAIDEFTHQVVYRDQKGVVHLGKFGVRPAQKNTELYHANKKTASKKHLKAAGL